MKNLFVFASLLFSTISLAETVTINGEDDWAPYSSKTADEKSVEGFAPDIIKAAFKTQGVDVVFKQVPYARCLAEVNAGDAVGCFDTVQDDDSKAKFIFHKTPLFNADMVVFAPSTSAETIAKISDLEGKTVGVTNGYTYASEFTNNAKITKQVVGSEKDQLNLLANGRLQYGVVWGMPGFDILKKNPNIASKVKAIGKISTDALYINFSKKHKDGARMANIFEKGMQAINADGTYKKLEAEFKKKVGAN